MNLNVETVRYSVYNSDYLLEFILKYLDLNEQIKLLSVSERFAYILSNCMWPKTYFELNLTKTHYAFLISSENNYVDQQRWKNWNKIEQTKVALHSKLCKDFLILQARNVKVLNVFSENYIFLKEVSFTFKNIKFFRNLTELCYYRLIINDEQMKILSNKCKKLQKLHMMQCYNEYLTPLVPGEHLNLQNIYEMENLQELVFESEPLTESILKSYHIQEIFLNLKLTKLILKNFTINDNDVNSTLALNNSLVTLDLGLMSMRFWPRFLQYLQHFENLKELHINFSDCNTTLDIKLMDSLANKCKQLEKLSLEKCDLSVDDFGVLKNLKHLSLTACGYLTFANFQQIFGSLKLVTFALIHTRIYGTINYMYISPSLEEITIDTIRFTEVSDAFQKTLNRFENLHTLKWLNGSINDNWIIEKCPELKYLYIPNLYSHKKIVFTIKSLKELTFTSCGCLTWCVMFILIHKLTLDFLCLKTEETIKSEEEVPHSACGNKTTLKVIVMPINIFKMAQTFWIDLLCVNENLKFGIFGKHEEVLCTDYIVNLLNDKKFRDRVKQLTICGLKYDCFDCLNNFDESMYRINKYTSHYRSKNENIMLEM